MSAIAELVGPQIQTKHATVDSTQALADKEIVALYFSAHWCPPCRAFTPVLIRVYDAIKQQHPDFEIIFVSSDQDESSFKNYYATHPWTAIPYSARDVKDKLSRQFGISGIPSLIVLDAKTGKTIDTNGRATVMQHKEKAYDVWARNLQK